jgi:hypothetical protein
MFCPRPIFPPLPPEMPEHWRRSVEEDARLRAVRYALDNGTFKLGGPALDRLRSGNK